jgi:hypothetical protein
MKMGCGSVIEYTNITLLVNIKYYGGKKKESFVAWL